jgi:hypothetical protein
MSSSVFPRIETNDLRIAAAIVAAIQAYMDSETIAEASSPIISAWQHAARALQAGDHFGRQLSWRGID